ncbi:MAG: PIN domain-containing protein [Verrucomicrobiota bacterium]|jgi:predicted nucleic acid-binding protein
MTFIDTGAFLARYLPSDQHHKVASALWEKVRTTHERCVTSNFVLDETFTLLARRASYSFAAEKARIIYAANSLEILRPDSLTELAALNWFEKFADQEVSFTDCVSFALMREADIQTAFSFDSHFERAGFKKWK